VAVVARFTVQDVVQTLPLALLSRGPFIPAKLPVRPEHHYRAQIAFLPVVGMGQWLLMGATAHGLLRLTGQRSDLSRVLDVIGVGMLIPVPPLWLCDVALIAADRFRLPELAVVNPTVQLWETALFGIGLRTALGVPWRRAMPAGLAASVVYVLGASADAGLTERPRSLPPQHMSQHPRPVRHQPPRADYPASTLEATSSCLAH
jgi:Yip1 domain